MVHFSSKGKLSVAGNRKRRILATCLLLATFALGVTETVAAPESDEKRRGAASRLLRRRQQQQRQQRQQERAVLDVQDLVLSFSEDESSLRVGNQRGGAGGGAVAATVNQDREESLVVQEENGAEEEPNESRIIGGKDAEPGDFPFFVEWQRGCGGTLIAPDLVLSAAHCYNPRANRNKVWVGGVRSEQGRERTIVEVRVHPLYDPRKEAYDFVVLRLNQEIRGAITPVTLNTRPYSYRQPADNEQLTVIGLGVLDVMDTFRSNYLQEVNVNYVANCAQRSKYDQGLIQEDIMFCAGAPEGGKDSCQGDSGGPILDAQNRQIGVVSFGRGCGQKEFPGVYARVSAVSNWLEQIKCMSRSHRPADCVEIRVDMTYDNYPTENGWQLMDRENHVIYKSEVGSVNSPGLHSTNVVVRQGRYNLEVSDKVGDGMCCVYGEGYFSVYNGMYVVESSGAFTTETTLTFEVRPSAMSYVTEEETESPTHTVSMRLSVFYDDYPRETGWKLVNDETGAILEESPQGSVNEPGLLTRDFHHLSPGHYWFMIEDSSWDGICCRTGEGYVQIDQLDQWGNSVAVRYYNRGDFGPFGESDFQLI